MLPDPCAVITRKSCLRAQKRAQHIGVEGGGIALGRLVDHWSGLTLRSDIVDRRVEAAKTLDSPIKETAMSAPVVLITGALTGIGRTVAVEFARKGNWIVVSGRKEDAGEALATELPTLGAKAEFVRADVRNEDDDPPPMLCANAGGGEFKAPADITEKHRERIFSTNVR